MVLLYGIKQCYDYAGQSGYTGADAYDFGCGEFLLGALLGYDDFHAGFNVANGVAAEFDNRAVGIDAVYLSLGCVGAVTAGMVYVVTEVLAFLVTHAHGVHHLAADLDDVALFGNGEYVTLAKQDVVIGTRVGHGLFKVDGNGEGV